VNLAKIGLNRNKKLSKSL